MPTQQTLAHRQARRDRRMAQAEATVPHGPYCYTRTGTERGADGVPIMKVQPCPYLKKRGDWPEQMNGYCRLLKAGDNSQGRDANGRPRRTNWLWDGTKECGVNDRHSLSQKTVARIARGMRMTTDAVDRTRTHTTETVKIIMRSAAHRTGKQRS